MFKRILVATDLSPAAYALVECLGGLTAFEARECLLLQCLNLQEHNKIALSYTTAVLQKLLKHQKVTLERQGYVVEVRVSPGACEDEVNRIAVEEDYDLIVTAAQEHTAMGELFFEGLAYKVIHSAQKPVLMIRMEPDPNGRMSCIKTIGCDLSNHVLFPTDFSLNADVAFEAVEGMVADGVHKVSIVHILDDTDAHGSQDSAAVKQSGLESLKKRLLARGPVEVETFVKKGGAADQILQLIPELGVKLVVMGSQGRGFVPEIFLGSVSHKVARHSPASILLVPVKYR